MKVSKAVFGSLLGMALGLVMSVVMSFFMLATQLGFIEGFLFIWLKSSASGFAVSAPIGLIVAPLMERFLRSLFVVEE
jgi:hypothetical protein